MRASVVRALLHAVYNCVGDTGNDSIHDFTPTNVAGMWSATVNTKHDNHLRK